MHIVHAYIHSWNSLLGTHVHHLLIHAIIQSASRVPAVQCKKIMQIRASSLFTSAVRMGEKCELSDSDCGMIVGARNTGLSVSRRAHQ